VEPDLTLEEESYKFISFWARFKPPKNRPKIFADSSLPPECVDYMRSVLRWDVIQLRDASPSPGSALESAVYERARLDNSIFLTMNLDYLNDDRFPLRLSPGIIVIDVDSKEPEAINLVLGRHYQFLGGCLSKISTYFRSSKMRITSTGWFVEVLSRNSQVELYRWVS
jgi:hypothetical protein